MLCVCFICFYLLDMSCTCFTCFVFAWYVLCLLDLFCIRLKYFVFAWYILLDTFPMVCAHLKHSFALIQANNKMETFPPTYTFNKSIAVPSQFESRRESNPCSPLALRKVQSLYYGKCKMHCIIYHPSWKREMWKIRPILRPRISS